MTVVDAGDEITVNAFDTAELAEDTRATVHRLFAATYEAQNHQYLDEQLRRLRYLAVAHDGVDVVGFALGECRVIDLPDCPGQAVSLTGICCVLPAYRRRGLFRQLERACLAQPPGRPWYDSVLLAARLAHPASLRALARNPTLIPRPNWTPNGSQRAVASAIATVYGVTTFDSERFICIGDGTAIGHPKIDVNATPDEWNLFTGVDRARGDSLLALSWSPRPPSHADWP